ncbi:hypothetical protein NEILACOT_05521 [Neisseria lactamica ATCC 23970]|uniref:Uncharacterized protein n=1 Tax=Neisseria lactamica ATCC 23970 TaxID=546265 RepID=D0WD85_NEILA|nr:hypothetical protein NEILACOT_05521 [Neisseria lactamica ATCC 23970]
MDKCCLKEVSDGIFCAAICLHNGGGDKFAQSKTLYISSLRRDD